MAFGRDAVAQLQSAAAGGRLELSKEQAHELAGHYQWFAEEMAKRQQDASSLVDVSGFGGFVSAQQLQVGFSKRLLKHSRHTRRHKSLLII